MSTPRNRHDTPRFSQEWAEQGDLGPDPSHVCRFCTFLRRTRRDHRPGTVTHKIKDRCRTAQPVAEPEGRRPLQGRTLRERHHRSDGRDVPTDSVDTAAPADGAATGTTARRRRSGTGLEGMVLAELQQVASGLGIRGTARMRKSQLIEVIKETQAGGAGRVQGRRAGRRGRRDQAEAPRHLQGPYGRGRHAAVAGGRPRRPWPSSRSTSPVSRPVTTSPPASAAGAGPPPRRAAPRRQPPRPRTEAAGRRQGRGAARHQGEAAVAASGPRQAGRADGRQADRQDRGQRGDRDRGERGDAGARRRPSRPSARPPGQERGPAGRSGQQRRPAAGRRRSGRQQQDGSRRRARPPGRRPARTTARRTTSTTRRWPPRPPRPLPRPPWPSWP